MQVRVGTRCLIGNLTLDRLTDTHTMKPTTAKPSDQVMRYFTPELFLRFNSPDDGEADLAGEAWDAALMAYRKHLEGIPCDISKFADLGLHDAELYADSHPVEPLCPVPFNSAGHPPMAMLALKRGDEFVSLAYSLWDRVREHPSPANWPFSKLRAHWLYDEVDLARGEGAGGFVHRILLSDGRILEIPFLSATQHRLPLPGRII
jgi:hypothetical protein